MPTARSNKAAKCIRHLPLKASILEMSLRFNACVAVGIVRVSDEHNQVDTVLLQNQ